MKIHVEIASALSNRQLPARKWRTSRGKRRRGFNKLLLPERSECVVSVSSSVGAVGGPQTLAPVKGEFTVRPEGSSHI